MESKKKYYLKIWDKTNFKYDTFYISKPEHTILIDKWIKRNENKIPNENELGAVIPELELIITFDGDIDSKKTRSIEIYRNIDSTGTQSLIPLKEINLLLEIFKNSGIKYSFQEKNDDN